MRLKRVISAALAVSMAVSMMPATAVSAFATDVGKMWEILLRCRLELKQKPLVIVVQRIRKRVFSGHTMNLQRF